MVEIHWIKITTDMFDNRKIRHLRKLPDGNNIVLIWVMLLTMAGRCNADGRIYLTENIPYTPKMLADELDFEESTVRLALEAFERLNMVVSIDGNLTIAGWEEYQNVAGLERVREQARIRMRNHRTRQRLGITSEGENCVYCGKPAETVDHIVPKCKGGQDVAENLVPCCKSCNSSKSKKDLADFLNDSFFYKQQQIDHNLVRNNEKLMAFVEWDEKTHRYTDVTQRYTDVTQQNKNKSKKENKKENINTIPPRNNDTEKGNDRTYRAGAVENDDFEGVSGDGGDSERACGAGEAESRRAEGTAGRGSGNPENGVRGTETLNWRDLSTAQGRLH